MGDAIFFGVLRMPPELWRDDDLDKRQRHARYVQAADEIEALRAEVERLREREAGLLEQHHRDSATLRATCAERDEARADERTAMGYLAGVRQVAGGEDFPDMVRQVERLAKDAARYEYLRGKVYGVGEGFGFEGLPPTPRGWRNGSIAQHFDAAIDKAMEAGNDN